MVGGVGLLRKNKTRSPGQSANQGHDPGDKLLTEAGPWLRGRRGSGEASAALQHRVGPGVPRCRGRAQALPPSSRAVAAPRQRGAVGSSGGSQARRACWEERRSGRGGGLSARRALPVELSVRAGSVGIVLLRKVREGWPDACEGPSEAGPSQPGAQRAEGAGGAGGGLPESPPGSSERRSIREGGKEGKKSGRSKEQERREEMGREGHS